MAGYQVGHRVTVYSGSSDSVQLFQVHSLKGQSNPYLSDVRITGRRIHVPECTAAPGQARFRVLDKRNASGDTTDRFLTEFLGDSENRHALRHSRVEVDVTDDGGSTWMREFTGRMHDIDQASKNEFEIIVNDLRADETDDIFDGTVPTVDWASEPILMPAGRLSGRQYGFFPTVTAPNADFEEVDFGGQYSASYAIATTERGPKTMVLQGLKEAAQYVKDSPGSGVRPRIAPDLRAFYEPGDSTYRGFHVGVLTPEDPSLNRLGRENVLSMDDGRLIGVLVENLDGDGDPAPLINTDGSMYLSSNAPPTTTAPLHIGVGSKRTGVNWAEVVSGVAHGAFGGGGFAIDYPRFNTLIQDDEQPKLRFRVKDGPVSASEWLETEVFPTVGYAPAVTASGTMYPVTYDPPDTTSGLFEFTRENVIDARWSQSRTGQINHVEIQMIAEREIPTDTIKFEDPVDLIVESDGDRVIVNRDDGKKRKPFQIKANGLRALYGATGLWSAIQWALQPIQLRKYAEERANRILDRFQDGTQDVVILARRTAGTKNVYIGDHVLVSVPWVPNYTQKVRGGTRLMLVLEKSVEPDGTYRFVCNDAGPVATASAPTLDGLDKNAVDGKHAYDVTITPPGDPERAILQVATVDSGAAEPSAGSELWTNAVGVSGTAQQSVTVSNLASRRTHWFRAQGRGPGKLPSAYTTALSGTTDAISAPSSLNVTISGAAAILTWTNGNASYPVMPVLGDPAASNYLDSPLEAGASRFRFVDLDPSTTYSFGVKHLDPYGGDSTTTSISGTTAGSASTLFAPQNLTILQGRTSDDQGQDGDVSLGTGIEIQWAKTEPYADTVVHYDDNSGFTSPTAVSGIETNRLRVNFPLDDTTRYFRAFHQEAGYTTSVASDTVSAKPVAFLDESSQFDGFASGSAALDVDPANDIILSVSSADPDTNGAYYTLNTSSFSEPTTSDNFISRGEMPYSQTQGITLNSGTTGYLWLKFWSRTAGFGQSTKEQITVGTVPPDSIASEHIQDSAVIEAKINDEAVEWAKIADDAVRENNIIARGVAARHLFVGSFDNLVANPGFEQSSSSLEGWTAVGGSGGSWAAITSSVRTGGVIARYDPTGQSARAGLENSGETLGSNTDVIAVGEGDQIYAECYVRKFSTGAVNDAGVVIVFRDENGAFVSGNFTSGLITPTTSYAKTSQTATAPAGAAYAAIQLTVSNDGNTEHILFDDVYARRMVEGSIVVDGTITTDHLEANSVTAGKIAANSVGTEQLFVGSFDNLVQNPGFEQSETDLPGWTAQNSGGAWALRNGAQRSGGNSVEYDPSGQTSDANLDSRTAPVGSPGGETAAAAEGDQVYAEAYARKIGTGAANQVRLVLRWQDEDGSSLSFDLGTAITPTQTMQKITVTGTAPAGTAGVVVRAQVVNDGNSEILTFDDVYARRMVEGSIVVDGTLTATHVESLSFSGKTAIFDQGKVGGWTMASGTLSSFNATLDATNEQFRLGSATAPFVGTGVFIGNDGSGNYDARFGDPSNEYVFWDAGSGTVTHQGSRFTATNPAFKKNLIVEGDTGNDLLLLTSGSDGGRLFWRNTAGSDRGDIQVDSDDNLRITSFNAVRLDPGELYVGAAGGRVFTLHKDLTSREVTGTTAETTLETITVPADTLAATGGLRIVLKFRNIGASGSRTIRVKWGGTNIATWTESAGTAGSDIEIVAYVFANGSTSSQRAWGSSIQGGTNEADAGAFVTLSEDTTLDVDIDVTGDLSDGVDSIDLEASFVEYVSSPV